MENSVSVLSTPQVGLILCTQGSAELLLSGQLYSLRPRMVYITSPIFPSQLLSASPDYQVQPLTGNIEEIYPLFQQMMPTVVHFRIIEQPIFSLTQEVYDRLYARARELEDLRRQEQTDPDPHMQKFYHMLALTLLQDTILRVVLHRIRQLQESPAVERHFNEVTYRFVLSLFKSQGRERRVAYYAEQAHLSPTRFSLLVQQSTGKNPKEWINLVCINQAKTLLRDPKLSVKQVAEQLEFPEQFTFRKYFKHLTGVSPTEFRKS